MTIAPDTCKMRIRLWDMQRKSWDTLLVTVPGNPQPGPTDEYLEIIDSAVEPDKEGNFISKNYTDDELDAVHTFAIARLTIDLWENALKNNVIWPWNTTGNKRKLKIIINSSGINAEFHEMKESMVFGAYGDDFIPTCRSLDIVAHETTHALIEGFRPDIHYMNTLRAFAVVEALCDLSPILLQASIPEIVSRAINYTANDLTQINPLSEFAEGYSADGIKGIRSALKPFPKGKDSYTLGSPLIHTVYNHMVEEWEKSPTFKDFQESAKKLSQLALYPILNMTEIAPENYISQFKSDSFAN